MTFEEKMNKVLDIITKDESFKTFVKTIPNNDKDLSKKLYFKVVYKITND